MKLYLTDQQNNFKQHLEFLKSKNVMRFNKTTLTRKITTKQLKTSGTFEELDLGFFFNYRIFPPHIMAHYTQWMDERRQMKPGDTILQQAYIPPVKMLSQKIIFGVRISQIINERYRKGFSYETLEGHVEKGISTFTVEQVNGQVYFKIETYSTPGNLLTKLVGPFFSVPYQTYCTGAALNNVKQQLENQ